MVAWLAALLLSAIGIGMLRASWRRRSPRHTVARVVAWLLIGAGLVPATIGLGAEIGTVVALLLPSLVACAIVLAGAEQRPVAAVDRPRRPLAWPAARTLRREGARALVLLGICPLVAGVLALAVARLTTATDNNALAVLLLGFSLIWGVLATIAGLAQQPLRAGGGVLLLGVLTIPLLT